MYKFLSYHVNLKFSPVCAVLPLAPTINYIVVRIFFFKNLLHNRRVFSLTNKIKKYKKFSSKNGNESRRRQKRGHHKTAPSSRNKIIFILLHDTEPQVHSSDAIIMIYIAVNLVKIKLCSVRSYKARFLCQLKTLWLLKYFLYKIYTKSSIIQRGELYGIIYTMNVFL